MSKALITSVVIALCALVVPAWAQADAPPPYVAVLDGDVTLVRDGQPVNAIVNMPVVSGDRLTTTAGRVEVIFPDGTALDLDENVTADFDGARVRLSSGRALLIVPAGANAARYEIDTPSGAVISRGPGKYRADAAPSSVWAQGSPSPRANLNDGFESWSDALRAARTVPAASASAQHLPEELQPYDATLDQNGSWGYAPTYGYVWYPRVESDWRPYYEGSWTAVPSYGWTWIGVHRWEYPTHHYGRWGYANSRWFWIPGRAYSPAWVAWGYAGDYVSWCPLGIDSRPVFAMTVGYGNPWAGWTVVSRSHFGGRGYVPRFAVAPHQLPTQTPFVVQHTAPPVTPRVNGFNGGGFTAPSNGGVAVPRAPVSAAPVPVAPQTLPAPAAAQTPTATTPVPQRTPDDRRPPAGARGQRRPNDAQSAPGNPGDNPAYAPRYAPPPAQTQAPESSGSGKATPRTPPPSTSSTPPASPPPQKPASAKPAEGSHKPAQKPVDNGKARGRGGL